MPLYSRKDSPYWWVCLGDDLRESTKIPHEGRTQPHPARDALALEYEAARALRYWRDHSLASAAEGRPRLPERAPVSFGQAAADYLKASARKRTRERECLVWLLEKPRPQGPQLRETNTADLAEPEALTALRNLSDAQGRSQGTTDRYMSVVSAVLTHARKVMKAPGLEGFTVPMYRPVPVEPAYFTREQWAALAPQLPEHLYLAALFAIATLLRMRAQLSLTWDHVDVVNRTAWVSRANMKGQRAAHRFPLNSLALWCLEQLQRQRVKGCPWVFHWNGRRIGDLNRTAFHAALKRAGLPQGRGEGQYNWHSFRHTGATWARQGGAQDGELQDLGGWVDSRMVRRYSQHGPVPAHIRAASEAITGGELGPVVGLRGGSGAAGNRTPDLCIANAPLSQLSYRPPRNHTGTQNPHVSARGPAAASLKNLMADNVLHMPARTPPAALRRRPRVKKSRG